jgi:hypothetical protein
MIFFAAFRFTFHSFLVSKSHLVGCKLSSMFLVRTIHSIGVKWQEYRMWQLPAWNIYPSYPTQTLISNHLLLLEDERKVDVKKRPN